jgi:protein-S-isoprenylcysteine O-methyltransferase Ste14
MGEPVAFDEFTRAALAWHFTLLAVFYTAKISGGNARGLVSVADPGPAGTVQARTHAVFRVFRVLIWAVCVLRAVDPRVDPWFVPFSMLQMPFLTGLGLFLLLLSSGIVVYVHSYMGSEWRSGVARKAHAPLITTGPYSIVRNPMFDGIILGQIGFFLVFPSLFSLFCFAVGLVCIISQAAYEEKMQLKHFGALWQAYMMITPRWIPKWRRKRHWDDLRMDRVGPVSTGQSVREPHSAHEPS